MLKMLPGDNGHRTVLGTDDRVSPTKLVHYLLRKQSAGETRMALREPYLVNGAKVRLVTEIAERQLEVIPDLFHLDKEVVRSHRIKSKF